ncbi:hypothetical protein D3C87_81420 [compost metagenome]
MNDEHCPICESEMLIINGHMMRCKNKCYILFRNGWVRKDVVFGEEFITTSEDTVDSRNIEKRFKKTLAYWKKNDRYLIKLMEN